MTHLQARVEALRVSCERAMNAPRGSKALISYQAGRYDALGDVLLLLATTRYRRRHAPPRARKS